MNAEIRKAPYLQRMERQIEKGGPERGTLYYIPETNLRCGHLGLADVARRSRNKIDVANLRPGEYVVFTNKAFTAFKLYAGMNAVCHVKMPDGERLNPLIIKHLPRFFNGKDIDMRGASAAALNEQFENAVKRKRTTQKTGNA